jgi:hypothetical protein
VTAIVESILAWSYAFVVVSLRYLIVGGWAAAVVLAVMFLPPRMRPAPAQTPAPAPVRAGDQS